MKPLIFNRAQLLEAVANANPEGVNQYSHGTMVRIKPNAKLRKDGQEQAHPLAGHVGTVYKGGQTPKEEKEDRERGRIRVDFALPGQAVPDVKRVSLSHVEPHAGGYDFQPASQQQEAKSEVFGKSLESAGDTGTSGLLAGVSRVRFHSGEHAGKTGTLEGVIPMRYSKSETTHRIKFDEKDGDGRNQTGTATTAHLKKHATTLTANAFPPKPGGTPKPNPMPRGTPGQPPPPQPAGPPGAPPADPNAPPAGPPPPAAGMLESVKATVKMTYSLRRQRRTRTHSLRMTKGLPTLQMPPSLTMPRHRTTAGRRSRARSWRRPPSSSWRT